MSEGTEVRDQRLGVGNQASASGSVEPAARREIRDQRSEISNQKSGISDSTRSSVISLSSPQIALLTGGGDKPYALGLATALTSKGVLIDFIGSDDLKVPEVVDNPGVNFLKSTRRPASGGQPVGEGPQNTEYYVRLIGYTAAARPKLLHILWNNKLELFDRTLLMLYYRLLGKRIAFTAHNVNVRKRDGGDSFVNRLSLKIQYELCHHIFVHTDGMKRELVTNFFIPESKVSVIPFGINNTVPNTTLSIAEAKQQLGVDRADKTILFFGNIAPYKGLEYLISAFTELLRKDRSYRLIIVGKPKRSEDYWNQIRQAIERNGFRDRIIEKIEYVPDEQTELYFKAADVLILPYTRVFQSGVLFLGYSFGLPAIAADVGTLKEDIIDGQTGFVFRPQDSSDLAGVISKYFEGELFLNLETRRAKIREYANEQYSWDKGAAIMTAVYSDLLRRAEGRGQSVR